MFSISKLLFSAAFLVLFSLAVSNTYAASSKPTVYDFAASWCEPCRRDVARDNQLHSEGIANFVLVIEDVDIEKGKAFVESTKPNFPVEYDPDHSKAKAMGAADSTPSLVIVGSDGQTTEVVNGSIDIDALRDKIKKYS